MDKVNKRHVRNDIILIAVLLAAVAALSIYLFFFRSTGDIVQVTVNGKVYGEYPLSQDRTEEIQSGDDAQQHNRLIIRGGKAFVETATCPDKICSQHAPIFRDGESIICLPHRVVITVIASQK